MGEAVRSSGKEKRRKDTERGWKDKGGEKRADGKGEGTDTLRQNVFKY